MDRHPKGAFRSISFLAFASFYVYKRFTVSAKEENALALTVGARIGPFVVKSRLGEGGMGIVFCALDTKRASSVNDLQDSVGRFCNP